MRNISRRIDTVEKKLSVGKRRKPTFPTTILCLAGGHTANAEDKQKLGPKETWITYQEQLQPQQKANEEYQKENPDGLPAIIKIELDADKEYKARKQRKATKNNQIMENRTAK